MAEDKRSQAWGYIKKAVIEGWGANETLDFLKANDLGYRRTDFLADYRNYANIPESRGNIKYTPKDKSVSDRYITKTEENISGKFKVIIEADVIDRVTNEPERHLFTLKTDIKKTIKEWESDFSSDFSASDSSEDFNLVDFHVLDVYKRT